MQSCCSTLIYIVFKLMMCNISKRCTDLEAIQIDDKIVKRFPGLYFVKTINKRFNYGLKYTLGLLNSEFEITIVNRRLLHIDFAYRPDL